MFCLACRPQFWTPGTTTSLQNALDKKPRVTGRGLPIPCTCPTMKQLEQPIPSLLSSSLLPSLFSLLSSVFSLLSSLFSLLSSLPPALPRSLPLSPSLTITKQQQYQQQHHHHRHHQEEEEEQQQQQPTTTITTTIPGPSRFIPAIPQVRCKDTILAHKSTQILALDLSKQPTCRGCF